MSRSDGIATPVVAESVPSIAVLPFADPRAIDGEEYFGDGVAETLIHALGQVDGLRVAAQTATFSFRGENVDLGSVGEQLNVGTVLRGSVQRAGDRLRVTVRLESTADGAQLWSGQYDEQAADVFAIQDAIARAVVDELQVTLLGASDDPIVRPGTEDLEAYNLYLQGRHAWSLRGEGLTRSLELFQQAVALDPFYARAHAGIAAANVLLGFWAYRDPAETIPLGRASAELALSVDPSLAEAHAVLGWISWLNDWDADAAETHFQQAIAFDSTYAPAHYWYGAAMATLRGDADLYVTEARRAVALDPLSAFVTRLLSQAYSYAGRRTEALETARRSVQLSPSANSYRGLVSALLDAGRTSEAHAAADTAVTLSNRDPVSLMSLAQVHMHMGDTARVRGLQGELMRQSEYRHVPPAMVGLLLWWLGDEMEGEAWLERAFAERDPFLILYVAYSHWGWGTSSAQIAPFARLWPRMVGQ